MDIVAERLLKEIAPLFKSLVVVLMALGVGAILYLGKEILLPFSLALLLTFALSPVVTNLRRAGAPKSLAVFCAVVLALAIVGCIGYVVAAQIATLAGDLPRYQSTLHEKIEGLQQSLSSGGPFSRFAAMLGELAGDLQRLGQNNAPNPQPVVIVSQSTDRLAALGEYLAPLVSPIASFVLVLLFTAFMLAQREEVRNRLIRLMGSADLQQTTAALDDVGRRLARMLLAQLAMNAAFALAIGVGLMAIGLPSPFLWGVLAGVLRFIPYVGAIVGGIAPVSLAFAVDPGWTQVLATAGLFLVLEPLFGHAIEPLLFGKSSGLSPLAVLVSAALWGFIWGPLGLVLSTPLTIVLVVIGRHVSRLEFLDILFSDRPALEPHEVFYQRMLAGDPVEARLQAREFLRDRTIADYCDEIVLPALRLAHVDIMRGLVEGERLSTLLRSFETLLANLAAEKQSPESAPGTGRLLILHSEDPLDDPAAHMLAEAIAEEGAGVEVRAMTDQRAENLLREQNFDCIVLCFFEPLSAQHMRASARAVRRLARGAELVICIWQAMGEAQAEDLRRKLHTRRIATGAADALLQAGGILPAPVVLDQQGADAARPLNAAIP